MIKHSLKTKVPCAVRGCTGIRILYVPVCKNCWAIVPTNLKQKLGEALSVWNEEIITSLNREVLKHGTARLEIMRQNGIKI